MFRGLTIFCVLLTIELSAAVSHRCIHDEIVKNLTKQFIEIPKPLTGERSLVAEEYAPIRIHADYSNLNQRMDPKYLNFITEKIVPATVNYLESILNVIPFPTQIAFGKAKNCYEALIPYRLRYVGAHADLVLFVTASPTQDDFLAWATSCFFEVGTGRPVAGQININLNGISLNEVDFLDQLRIFIHETTHVLGFSNFLYSSFIDPETGKKLSEDSVFQSHEVRGVYTPMIVLPSVVEVAKKYFKCDSIVGVELENQGTEASLGSHWERRILGDEFMTASQKLNAKISEFTMALLEGSGWYKVNYTKADYLVWGRDRGCSFLDDNCIDEDYKSKFVEFCDELDEEYCTLDHKYKGVCATRTKDNIPAPWDYFHSNHVGLDSFADFCPYPIYYSNGNCEDSGPQYPYYEQVYGKESRCFEGTLLKQKYKPNNHKNTFCLKYACQPHQNLGGVYKLKVSVGSHDVICASEGETKTVKGYSGYLSCPNPQEFCEKWVKKYCQNGCNGRGDCINGTCACYNGWNNEYSCTLPKQTENCAECEGRPCYGDRCLVVSGSQLKAHLVISIIIAMFCLFSL